jgi:hypothetical protein
MGRYIFGLFPIEWILCYDELFPIAPIPPDAAIAQRHRRATLIVPISQA